MTTHRNKILVCVGSCALVAAIVLVRGAPLSTPIESAKASGVTESALTCPTATDVPVNTLTGAAAKARIEELYRANPEARAKHEENIQAIRAHGATPPADDATYLVVSYPKPVSLHNRLWDFLFPTAHAQAFDLGEGATLYFSEGDFSAEVTIADSVETISGTFICCQGPAPWPPYPDWSWPPWVGRFANCAMGWCLGSCISARGNLRGCGLGCAGSIAACGYNEYMNYRGCRASGKRSDEC